MSRRVQPLTFLRRRHSSSAATEAANAPPQRSSRSICSSMDVIERRSPTVPNVLWGFYFKCACRTSNAGPLVPEGYAPTGRVHHGSSLIRAGVLHLKDQSRVCPGSRRRRSRHAQPFPSPAMQAAYSLCSSSMLVERL